MVLTCFRKKMFLEEKCNLHPFQKDLLLLILLILFSFCIVLGICLSKMRSIFFLHQGISEIWTSSVEYWIRTL